MAKSPGVFALALCVAGLLLSGCTSNSDYVASRKANLEAAVEDFDAGSIGEVICEHFGGEAAYGRGFTYRVAFAGNFSIPIISERLTALGYEGIANYESISFHHAEGISVAGQQLAGGEAASEFEEYAENFGCELPPEGSIWLLFSEQKVAN